MMRDLRAWGVDILTVGQYLQPSRRHLPVARFYTPEEFAELKRIGLEELGFGWVESAPWSALPTTPRRRSGRFPRSTAGGGRRCRRLRRRREGTGETGEVRATLAPRVSFPGA